MPLELNNLRCQHSWTKGIIGELCRGSQDGTADKHGMFLCSMQTVQKNGLFIPLVQLFYKREQKFAMQATCDFLLNSISLHLSIHVTSIHYLYSIGSHIFD